MRIYFGSRQLLRITVTRCRGLVAQRIATHSSAHKATPLFVTSAYPSRQGGYPPHQQCYGQPRQWPISAPENSPHLQSSRGKAARASASMAAQLPAGDIFFLDEFAVRQWDNVNCSGTKIDHDKADFVARWATSHFDSILVLARHSAAADAHEPATQGPNSISV